MKKIITLLLIFVSVSTAISQNLVPNPSFEDTVGFFPSLPMLDCLLDWRDYSSPVNPALNTADLCYNTAVFFPQQGPVPADPTIWNKKLLPLFF